MAVGDVPITGRSNLGRDSSLDLVTMKVIGASELVGRIGGALLNASANPADGVAESHNDTTGPRGLWRPGIAGLPEDSPLISIGSMLRRVLAGMRRILGFGVMRASGPLRNRKGEPIRARAWLESARIEERYWYSQEISLNADVHEAKEPAGLIKLLLPYDGDEYFTRQAHRDVETARRGGRWSRRPSRSWFPRAYRV